MTLMSRMEPARALAKNSFSSSVATRTRNMVGERAGGRRHLGLLRPARTGGHAGSQVKYSLPCDQEPETLMNTCPKFSQQKWQAGGWLGTGSPHKERTHSPLANQSESPQPPLPLSPDPELGWPEHSQHNCTHRCRNTLTKTLFCGTCTNIHKYHTQAMWQMGQQVPT